MGSNHEQTGGRKSRDTLPLSKSNKYSGYSAVNPNENKPEPVATFCHLFPAPVWILLGNLKLKLNLYTIINPLVPMHCSDSL